MVPLPYDESFLSALHTQMQLYLTQMSVDETDAAAAPQLARNGEAVPLEGGCHKYIHLGPLIAHPSIVVAVMHCRIRRDSSVPPGRACTVVFVDITDSYHSCTVVAKLCLSRRQHHCQ